MYHLFNTLFLPIFSFFFLNFIDHNGQKTNSKNSLNLVNFGNNFLSKPQMLKFKERFISFWALIPKDKNVLIVDCEKFDIIFFIIFHLNNQNNFVSSLLEKMSDSNGLTSFDFFLWFIVVATQWKFSSSKGFIAFILLFNLVLVFLWLWLWLRVLNKVVLINLFD